jgi:hypothetical protein
MIINLGQIPDNDYLQAGIHRVFIYNIKHENPGNGGKPYLEVTFKDSSKRVSSQRLYISEPAMWRIKQLAVATGFDPNQQIDTANLIGKPVLLHLEKSTYQGKDLTKATKFEPIPTEQQAQQPPQQQPFQGPPQQQTGQYQNPAGGATANNFGNPPPQDAGFDPGNDDPF